MASSEPPPKVSKELVNAVQDDHMRSVRDAAKHRAVAQMEDYDGFKNMVSVAHLRPWHAPNHKDHGVSSPPAFAFTAEGVRGGPQGNPGTRSSRAGGLGGSEAADGDLMSFTVPTNSMQFDKTWRRSCRTVTLKWRYLGVFSDGTLLQLFKNDIGGTVLGEIVDALADGFEECVNENDDKKECHSQWQGSDTTDARSIALKVTQTLDTLRTCGRFDLARRLLGKKTKAKIEGLIGSLITIVAGDEHATRMEAVKQAYLA